MTHALKTWPEYFKAIHSGEKDFELRKDDRKYQVGEKIILQEWNPESETYTGNEVEKIIKYILRDAEKFGLKKGYIIMGLEDKNY